MTDIDITVSAPGRLHFGLLNLSPEGPRVDGGAGVMVDVPGLTVSLRSDIRFTVSPQAMTGEVEHCLKALQIEKPCAAIKIKSAIPPHAGLGWRTQLRLGISTAICSAMGLSTDPMTLAPRLGRGGTSGIGSWGFWYGGVIVDGGHLRHDKPAPRPSSQVSAPKLAPLIYQEPIPWWIVVGLAAGMKRVSGEEEGDLFKRHAPVPWSESLKNSHIVLMELIPASKECDFERFCLAVSELRSTGFKAREIAFRHVAAQRVIERLEAAGLSGVSMSSWGPAFFGFARSEADAKLAASEARSAGLFETVWVTRASQGGATVESHGERFRALELTTSPSAAGSGRSQ